MSPLLVQLVSAWLAIASGVTAPITVKVPLAEPDRVDVADIVARLAAASGMEVGRPSGDLKLSLNGLAGTLTRKMLAESLGPDVGLTVEPRALVVTIDPGLLAPGRRAGWEDRLKRLADRVDREVQRRARYGMHALASYRPNDPARPTVCLVHGVNSSSGGFVHMIPPLEQAGFGIVVYDYPYNRSLEESSAKFARDWNAFRKEAGEQRPWAILAHSMGALVARSYVEDPTTYGCDVSSLIMVAPVNQGSRLAKTQTLLQLIDGLQALKGKRRSDALAHLGDGLGEAAEDMTPGSVFLKALNRRPRAPGVSYHILAGDAAFLAPAARRRIEEQLGGAGRDGGLFRGLTRLAVPDLSDRLDEFTDGRGDGCVTIDRTRLAGVADHVTIHANHAELIRAPLLFPDPGPVVSMPYILKWLGAPRTGEPKGRSAPEAARRQ